jgi:hypothetical protein
MGTLVNTFAYNQIMTIRKALKMKTNLTLLLSLFYFGNCSSQVKTDDGSVKKIVTITEYLTLNNDFAKLDTVHQQKEIQKFDGNNNLLEMMNYWYSTETFGGGFVYKYDKKNNKIEEYELDTHNEISSKYSFEYSKNVSTQFKIKNDNTTIKWRTNYYDSNKNLVREITYYNDGKIMLDLNFKYNSNNQQIERSGTLDNKKIQTNYKSYDSLGKLIEQKSIDTNGIVISLEKFIYTKFDNNGNWEVRQSILGGQPHAVAFQKVEIK